MRVIKDSYSGLSTCEECLQMSLYKTQFLIVELVAIRRMIRSQEKFNKDIYCEISSDKIL